MAFGDFLFGGNPPPSTTTYGTSTTSIPQWYLDYQQGILAAGNAIASQEYQPYVDANGNAIQRIAGLTEDQQAAAQGIRDNYGAYQGILGQAASNLGSVDPNAGLNAGSTNLNAAAGIDATGLSQGYFGSALNQGATTTNAINRLTDASYNPAGVAASNGAFNAATNINSGQTAQPYLNEANSISATQAISPFVNQASQGAYSQIGNYLNPYQDAVVNRIGDLAARQLNEKLMPAINDQFIRSGQFGSARQQESTGRALRDVQESALAQQAQLMNQGYQQSMQAAQADLARQAQLGQLTGQMALGEQQNLGQLGQIAGSLDQQRMQALGQIGQAQGQISNQQMANQLQGLTSTGQLSNQMMSTLGQIGSSAGQIANQQMGNLANIGQVQGNLANTGTANMINANQQLANVANLSQTMGLRDAAALQAVGQEQQALDQANLDLAYQTFQDQVNYPGMQLNWLSNLTRGFQQPTTTTTTSTGPAKNYQASDLSNIVSGALLSNALMRKHGGRVHKKNGGRSTGALQALAGR